MTSRADQCNPIGTHAQATQRSKSRQKFRNSCGPRNRGISEAGSYSFLCWTTLKPSNEQTCVENENEVIEFSKQFQLGHWCFCGPGQHRQENDAKVLQKLHIQHSSVLNLSWKETLSPRRTKGPFTFRVRLKQKQFLFAPFWHAINYASTLQCVFGLIRNNLNKKRSHDFDPQRLNCFGRPHARQQNHCSNVTRCKFLNRSWQRPILCDQTLSRKKEDGHLSGESTHYLATIQPKIRGCFAKWMMCTLVQSWTRRERIGLDYNLL